MKFFFLSLALFAAVALCASPGFSRGPAYNGQEGLLRVMAADNPRMGHLHLGWHMDFGQVDSINRTSNQYYSLGYSIVDMVELSIGPTWLTGTTKDTNGVWGEGMPDGMGDIQAGLKFSFNQKAPARFGLFGFYNIPTLGAMGDTLLKPRDPYKHSGAAGGKGLFTLDMEQFRVHANVGFNMNLDKIDDESVYPNQSIPYGVAFEMRKGVLCPFIEIDGEYLMDSTREFSQMPLWITPGLRVSLPAGLNLDIAGDLNVASEDSLVSKPWPDYGFSAGLSYCMDIIPEGPKVGTIAGVVTDKDSGKPIPAKLTMGQTVIDNDPTTGKYEFTGVLPGTMEIEAVSAGYNSEKNSAELTKGMVKKAEPLAVNFALSVMNGTLDGTVVDATKGTPLAAAVAMPGGTSLPTDANGYFKTDMKPGKYTVTVSCPGYLSESVTANVVASKATALKIALRSKKEKIVLVGVYFDTGKATLRPESGPVLDNAAKILTDNPTVVVEIGGHTDSVGNDASNMKLSSARSDSVKNYLIGKGIAANRLVTKGYGETMPIAPNTSDEGRAKNRRIEFKVLSE